MKKLFLGILTLLTISSSIKAEIIETNEIADILPFVNEDTLVFLNVSNVLFQHSSSLGYQQWRDHFNHRVYTLLGKTDKAEEIINKVRNLLVTKLPKKTVEDVTPTLIADFQSKGIQVAAITERRAVTPYAENNLELVEKSLNDLGMDLSLNFAYAVETALYTFHKGILFTNRNPTGEAIAWWLSNSQKQRAILVDDSLKTLELTEKSLEEKGIEFIGFRYGRCDQTKANVSIELGTIEFLALYVTDAVITDEEAIQHKKNYPFNYEDFLDQLILQMASN